MTPAPRIDQPRNKAYRRGRRASNAPQPPASVAPCAAMALAIPRPMPRPPPVITATLPFSDWAIVLDLLGAPFSQALVSIINALEYILKLR